MVVVEVGTLHVPVAGGTCSPEFPGKVAELFLNHVLAGAFVGGFEIIFRMIYSWAGCLYALTNKATVIAT
jgi:hypothetical protein